MVLLIANAVLLRPIPVQQHIQQISVPSFVHPSNDDRQLEQLTQEANVKEIPQEAIVRPPQQRQDPCKKNYTSWYDVAKTTKTDKIKAHAYDYMYEKYLSPLLSSQRKVKFLEIGLGCDMKYGPGESLKVWKKYFECLGDNFELHFMEYDAKCATKWQGQFPNIPFHIGDQANTTDLERMLTKSGGEFDVIVDDGGHTMAQQIISIEFLLPKALKPGGLYFLEDMHSSYYVGRRGKFRGMYTVDFVANTINDMHKTEFGSSRPRSGWLHSHILNVDCMRAICVFTKLPTILPPGLVGKRIT